MLNVELFGTQSENYEFLKMQLSETFAKAGIEVSMVENQNVEDFISNDIQKVPALKIDDVLFERNGEDINEYVKRVVLKILEKENYGTMKKILVPLDYSEAAENALGFAYRMAEEMESMIQVVHTYMPDLIEASEYTAISNDNSKEEEKIFNSYLNEIQDIRNESDLEAPVIEGNFIQGWPTKEIIALSNSDKIDFVVMGSTGKSVEKKIFGSVSTKVASDASCPVILVPNECTYKPIKKIVYCCDDIESDANVVHDLSRIARIHGASIDLIHFTNDGLYEPSALLNLWKNVYPKGEVRFIQLPIDTSFDEALNTYCDEVSADLLALVRKKRSFLDQLFHVSKTRKLMINSRIPMWIGHSDMNS